MVTPSKLAFLHWHESVPRDLKENTDYRISLLKTAGKSRALRRGLMRACETDILFWINSFVLQHNPNSCGEGSAEESGFVTWLYQEQAIARMIRAGVERRDVLILKSREMGASWLTLLLMLWYVLFSRRKKFLIISRNEEAVDRSGDSDSLFWKMEYVLEHLPGWMTEGRWKRRKMRLENPLLGGSVTGQASTGKAGVGGRAYMMFLDEFSQVKEDTEVFDRTNDTTGCRIFNGTHKGLGTKFYELSLKPDIEKLYMHWSMHPDKARGLYKVDPKGAGILGKVKVIDHSFKYPDGWKFQLEAPSGPFPGLRSPWYDAQCRRRQSVISVAMDLDINPLSSSAKFFDELTLKNLKEEHCRAPSWVGELVYDKQTGKPSGIRQDPDGKLRFWFPPDHMGNPPRYRYGIGSDVCAGAGATNTVFSVGNERGEKVAEYANPNIWPQDAGVYLVALAWYFKDGSGQGAKLCWELQGPGSTMGKTIMGLGYRNVYWKVDEFRLSKGVSDVPGWFPDKEAKRLLMEDYRGALISGRFVNYSGPAIEECHFWEYDLRGDVVFVASFLESQAGHMHGLPNDPSGAGANHGDRVVADALCYKTVASFGSIRSIEPEAPPLTLLTLAGRRRHWQEIEEAVDVEKLGRGWD